MLKISPLFSDGAVLCRGKEIRVFGEAENGARVHCELRDAKDGLLAGGEGTAWGGKFLILLPPQTAQTGCRLILTGGGESLCALDISIGEVYLAGGQSNMEMELRDAAEGPSLIATHVNPMVRYFNVPKSGAFDRAREEAWARAGWQAIGPGRGQDISAAAYFFAMKLQRKLQVPVGIIDCCVGASSVTCWMDEDWLRRTGEGQRYLAESTDPDSLLRPAGLYATMVAPLSPLALTGILYYQGESDAFITDCYDVLLMSLIDRWRDAFRDEELPFLFVQLPMWIEQGAEDSGKWAALRLCQSRVRDRVRNTGMICLIDQGEFDNIHPANKRVVGERLYEAARTLIYGERGEASPRVTGKRISGSMMTLRTDQMLTNRDGREPALLELAGADGVFVRARAMIEGPMLHLTAPGVEYPLHARYAWKDYAQVNLFGGNGLPLEPFAF